MVEPNVSIDPDRVRSTICTTLAEQLKDPKTGDVVIEAVMDEEVYRFYAASNILSTYDYFTTSNMRPISHVNRTGLSTTWRQGSTKRKLDIVSGRATKIARTQSKDANKFVSDDRGTDHGREICHV